MVQGYRNIVCLFIAIICIANVLSQNTAPGQPNGLSFPSSFPASVPAQTMFLGQETGAASATGQTDSNGLQTQFSAGASTGQAATVDQTNQSQFGLTGAQNSLATNAIFPGQAAGGPIGATTFPGQITPMQNQPVNNMFPGQPPRALNTVFTGPPQTFPGQPVGQTFNTVFPGQPGGQMMNTAVPGQVGAQPLPGQPGMQTVNSVFPGQPGGQGAFPPQQGIPTVFPTGVFPGQPQQFGPQFQNGAFTGQTGIQTTGVTTGVTDQQGGVQTSTSVTGTGQVVPPQPGSQPGIITGQGQTFITGQPGQPGQPVQPGQTIPPGQPGQPMQPGQTILPGGQGQIGPAGQFGPLTRPFGPQNGQFGPQNGQFNPFNPFGPRRGQCHTTGCPGGSQCVFAPTGAHMCPTWIPILPCQCLQGCQAQNLFIPLGQSRQIDRCGNSCTCNSPDGQPACTMMACPSPQQQQQPRTEGK